MFDFFAHLRKRGEGITLGFFAYLRKRVRGLCLIFCPSPQVG